MNLNNEMLNALVEDATAANCTIALEVSSQGAVLTLTKSGYVPNDAALSKRTEITRWLDKNDPNINSTVNKTFRNLP